MSFLFKATLVFVLSLTGLASATIKSEQRPSEKIETTFGMIKPDAVAAGRTGQILSLIELNKFTINRIKKMNFSQLQAEHFYCEHKEKHFYRDLINYITSGPIIALELQKKDAVKEWRELMGATNPSKAAVGTLRRMFGSDVTHNAVHGSDSAENAQREIAIIFKD